MGKALAAVLGCALGLPLVAATLVGGILAVVLGAGPAPGGDSGDCAAPGGASASGFAGDQVDNAATMVAVGKQHQLPPRAWVIAVAAAMQESGLHNLDHGDRDSLGLFQQRPSAGWGSPAQIRDPVSSTTQFYRHLQYVPGWDRMPLTQAAQRVQGSATPGAYARHEARASQLVATVAGAHCGPDPASS